ncbi:MAG: hypothetical protein KDC44_23795, partial [Phaeodactylibacter sp.]|nr:hypothetical protein [Phaeodactylibacter sp.]
MLDKMEDRPASKINPKLTKSPLDGTDDFFAKAARFADGDYHNSGKPKPEGEITLSESDAPEEPLAIDNRKAAGFEDADGDGNEIVDD